MKLSWALLGLMALHQHDVNAFSTLHNGMGKSNRRVKRKLLFSAHSVLLLLTLSNLIHLNIS